MTRTDQVQRIKQAFRPMFATASECRHEESNLRIDGLALEVLDLMRQGLVPTVCKCGRREVHALKDCFMLGTKLKDRR